MASKDFSDQLMAFFQELTETIKVLPRCALVVTLPPSAPYGIAGAQALHQLQQIFGRVETIYTPVQGDEVYEVIRRRLLEDPGDPADARRTAEGYWEIYQRLRDDVPRDVREPAYRAGRHLLRRSRGGVAGRLPKVPPFSEKVDQWPVEALTM